MSVEIKNTIAEHIKSFSTNDLHKNSLALFNVLGYNTSRQNQLDTPSFSCFKESFIDTNTKEFNQLKAKTDSWKEVHLLFQLTQAEITDKVLMFDTKQVDQTIIETYLFFAIELSESNYGRSVYSDITREVNKLFPMPVMVLFKNGNQLTLSVINRRLHKRDETKDVLEKITLIKDIDITNPHRAHIEILFDLSFQELYRKFHFDSFVSLHNAWQKSLDTKELNNAFYNDLFKWYLWAKDHAAFPNDNNEETDKYLSESLIRFISRLLFVWFMKEKKLIANDIFDKQQLAQILKNFDAASQSNSYYKAILQNLFFATLNVPIESRKWIDGQKKNKAQLGDPLIYRYESEFVDSTDAIERIFMQIPFLNGGLFDCLDDRENNVFVDGFTKNVKKQPQMPNLLFFGENKNVDLSHHFADDAKEKKKWQNQAVKGIIDLLHNYKFTIEENTPLEVDVALDPELLGKVFENLLASFNPETKTTARKQTGSFYTPREIVNYMVDESLKQHLITHLQQNQADIENLFMRNIGLCSETFKKKAVQRLFDCKILDPACGSGAFPMGVLHKMVELMTLLDPQNQYLKEMEGQKLDFLIQNAKLLSDANFRNQTVEMLQKQKEVLMGAEYDYVRKLYIIENCIYGVDIQPIAIQISKLRFFISLLVEQTKRTGQYNYGIEPLPNMDFKLVAANTLISTPQEDKGFGLFENQNEFFDQFDRLAHDYFTLHAPEAKKQKKAEIIKLINSKVEEKTLQIEREKSVAKNTGALEQSLKLWQSYPNLFKEKSVEFFDIPYFFPKVKGGFDVVIGNPPYGVSVKGNFRSEVIKHLGKVPDFEIYYYFIEVSKKLLSTNGIKSYIIPNTFLFNVYASDYRKQLIKDWVVSITDCTAFKIFDGATVLNAITIFQKRNDNKLVGYKKTNIAKDFNELIAQETVYIEIDELLNNNQNWSLAFKLDKKILQLITKIKKVCVKLESIFPDYSQGLIAYDKYRGQTEETIKNRVFHYDSFDKKYGLKKNLWGEDVNRYLVKWNEKEWIDYNGDIANPRHPKFFKGERILIREITNPRIFAAYTSEELYHDPSIIVVLGNDTCNIKYLLALLNSNLLTFYHFNSSPKASKGAFPKILVEDIKNFPVKIISPESQQPFITLVDQILAAKAANPQADTSDLEKQIDELVYQLYELTEEEIRIIEGKK